MTTNAELSNATTLPAAWYGADPHIWESERRAIFGREAVHPDHVSYFSYATLAQLLIRNGFRPVEYATFAYPTVTKGASAIFNILHRIAPSTADGIIIVATA